jgi:hypothetical protein
VLRNPVLIRVSVPPLPVAPEVLTVFVSGLLRKAAPAAMKMTPPLV